MRLVFLGLSLSSSWGNGHATTYRALLAGLAARGHQVMFLEREQPWYAAHRDLRAPGYCALEFYESPRELGRFAGVLRSSDAVVIGSYVPDGVAVIDAVRGILGALPAGARVQAGTASPSVTTGDGHDAEDHDRGAQERPLLCFYDIDTPVTLRKLSAGDSDYLSPAQVPQFDLYLSFTGGPTLHTLEQKHGARMARALFCSVDPELYYPTSDPPRWHLGYLGTYSADRQPTLERLLLEPARRLPHLRFVVAGSMYPPDVAWPDNVDRIEHLPPAQHASFYCSLRWALNVTRADMLRAGYSPSVRLFEATACGTPVISDVWPGLHSIFQPGREVLTATDTEAMQHALALPDTRRLEIAQAGRQRTLRQHVAARRAQELEIRLQEAAIGTAPAADRPGADA